ncbi:hypothetical protein D9M68_548120 [compost metagenome]
MDRLHWRCIKQPHYYLIICRSGAFELAETIDRDVWTKAIDRCLKFKRVIADLTRNMEKVVAASDRQRVAYDLGVIIGIAGGDR